ncbi:MmyB family transcriptional regulator [Allokutzneria albata]|uniref:MmyB family transcriptional regulator n=1 Tax=Allokutzneria albata TaxID=211114 RepID=UPI0004C42BD4|nr:hypothetical protein [Allokutzneria albata]
MVSGVLRRHPQARTDHHHPDRVGRDALADHLLGLVRIGGDLRAGSPRSPPCWRPGAPGDCGPAAPTIEHAELDELTLDCDVLQVPESDQTLLVYSAAPGTPSASAPELLRVTGLEQFSS